MIHHSISVTLPLNEYPIYIGQQLLNDHSILDASIQGHQVMVVSQENIATYYLPVLMEVLKKYDCHTVLLKEGEQYKDLDQWQKILDELIQHQHERSTTLIALGGGMIGDLTGFAAACYLRGVNYIQIPTTLIAQVDAAIGGKTGVNHRSGKNLIGVFYQPKCVISDVDVLRTLPRREFIAGLAEVVKYGLILDKDFFSWLEDNVQQLLAQQSIALLHVVTTCSRIKSNVVIRDEREQGIRSLLNFGHTFGHALEVANHYDDLLHGEAVGLGMMIASKLSATIGWISKAECNRIQKLFLQLGFMVAPKKFPNPDEFLQLMRSDKKMKSGKQNYILLKSIGNAEMTSDISEKDVVDVLTNLSYG